uniref:CCDC113/CCDC96 coiled-coil domain-containing protein n=1 Tax=Trepomonas sp. PC1 TaxID=1076344 RepID=A0A146KJE6_9EUKA|eukprot:JAP95389.1 hypothetical protein TPC1_11639 [Trepomonas sp. PC1]
MIDDKTNQSLDQQQLFLQDGLLEQQRLQEENEQLQYRISRLLTLERVDYQLKPFKDHASRSDAEVQIKYHQTLADLDQTRVDIAALQTKAEQDQMSLKSALDEVLERCQELQLQFQLLREAAISIQTPAFGVQLSVQQINDFEAKFKSLFEQQEQQRLKTLTLSEQVKSIDKQHKSKSENQKLQQIDYEQLKIANQSLAEKIEEKSEELLKLRRRTVQTLQTLAHVREKKNFVEGQVQELQRQQTGLDDTINKMRTELGELKVLKNKCRVQSEQSREQTGLSGNPALKRDYDERQQIVEGLHQVMGDLKREYGQLVQMQEEIKERDIVL